MEPALAESWEIVEDDSGTRIVFHLRAGLKFSDGEPFTAEDVAFTFRVLYDEATASQLTETVEIDGEPFVPEVLDAATVALRLPRLTATVERVFDSIRILPEHRLRASLDRGTLAADTGLGAPPENVVGLGPFRLREHVPGQRIVLERNPFYWRMGEGEDVFPRLSSIVFEVVPDGSARLLRLRSGDIDVLAPLAYEAFRALSDAESKALRLIDAGPGMLSERLWFNLNPASPIEEHKRRWFTDVRFRRAISLSIDRAGMARVVYSGLATPAAGSVSPANTFWKNASISPVERNVDRARELLAEAGFRWDEDDQLIDSAGTRVRFDIITSASQDHYRSVGAFIQEDLSALGIQARTRPLEGSSLLRPTHRELRLRRGPARHQPDRPGPFRRDGVVDESRAFPPVASVSVQAGNGVGGPHRRAHDGANALARSRAPESLLRRGPVHRGGAASRHRSRRAARAPGGSRESSELETESVYPRFME